MTARELERLLVEAIERTKGKDARALGLVLQSPKSPGPVLGIRCERLGVAPHGTAWAIPVGKLQRALDNVRQVMDGRKPR